MKKKRLPGLLDAGKLFFHPRAIRMSMDSLDMLYRLANLPIIRNFHPWIDTKKTNMFWIPVNKNLERAEDVVLPYQVVEELIDKSSHRVIMHFCGCRAAYECKNHPLEIGCLMMGEDTKKISPFFGRQASKKEARDHLKKVVKAGIPPFVGKARVDNFIFGIPDNGRLLTVCFCCQCCCISRIMDHLPPNEQKEQMPRLEGLEIWVDKDKCTGCGACVDQCFIHSLYMKNGKAHIPDSCRGCGRCALICPQEAIRLRLNNPDFVQQAVKSIESYVDLG